MMDQPNPIDSLPPWLHGFAEITREEAETQIASLTESLREKQWLQADIIAAYSCPRLARLPDSRKDNTLYEGWPAMGQEWARKLCRLGRLFPHEVRDYDKPLEWYLILAQLAQEASGIRYASRPNQWNEISEYAVQLYGNLADESLDELRITLYAQQARPTTPVPGMHIDEDEHTFTMEILIRGDGKLFFDDGHGATQPFSAKVMAQRLGPGRYTLVGVESRTGDDVTATDH
jgi:hypothetical protein